MQDTLKPHAKCSDVLYQSKTLEKVNLLAALYKFLILGTGLFIYDILDFIGRRVTTCTKENHTTVIAGR